VHQNLAVAAALFVTQIALSSWTEHSGVVPQDVGEVVAMVVMLVGRCI